MKNKIICLLLVMIMSVLCLAGCGLFGKDNGNDNEGGNNETGNNNGNNNGGTGSNAPTDKPNIGGGGDDVEGWWDDISYETTDLLFR